MFPILDHYFHVTVFQPAQAGPLLPGAVERVLDEILDRGEHAREDVRIQSFIFLRGLCDEQPC